MAYEQGRTAALLEPAFREQEGALAPVERARQMALLVRAGCGNFHLLVTPHPHRPDFGVSVDIYFILEDGNLIKNIP